MFVRGVVVSDDVERFVGGSLSVDETEKRNPVLIGMAVAALAEHATVECVQSGTRPPPAREQAAIAFWMASEESCWLSLDAAK